MSARDTKPEKEKAPLFVVLSRVALGAYRECGILPGEEMVRAGSTASVISANNIPSGKQVRECGARVDNNKAIISRSVLISWYISALPQYLERFAPRYTNPLRV